MASGLILIKIQDELAWAGAKLYVPASQRLKIMQMCHDAKKVGHFGFVRTLHLIKRQFWWPSLKKGRWKLCLQLSICASVKRRQGKTPGFLQTVAEPSAPWTDISMDFIAELKAQGTK